jgi:hypothetical protein
MYSLPYIGIYILLTVYGSRITYFDQEGKFGTNPFRDGFKKISFESRLHSFALVSTTFWAVCYLS